MKAFMAAPAHGSGTLCRPQSRSPRLEKACINSDLKNSEWVVSEARSTQRSQFSMPVLYCGSRQSTKIHGAGFLVYAIEVTFVALVSSTFASAYASDLQSMGMPVVHGQVQAPPQYLRDVRLTLNGGLLSVTPSASSTFEIGPLPPGSYLLQASHPLLHLPSYLVKIPTSSLEAPHVFSLEDSFRPAARLSLPLVIAPINMNSPLYFAVKPPFSLLLVLQQPLLLVAIACCALLWCLPRLQQYQEEDERQQRVALMQQHEMLPGQRSPAEHTSHSQENFGGDRRITTSTASWRGTERDRFRADVEYGRAGREEESEDFLERSAFAKCLSSLRSVSGGGGGRTPRVF